MNKQLYGRIGEEAAKKYLRRKGYRIIAENYLVKGGELDIVAFKHKALVFVEVKARSGDLFGLPSEAVGKDKIYHLRIAQAAFITKHCASGCVPVYSFGKRRMRRYTTERNDIIEVFITPAGKAGRINHITDAF